MRKRLTLYQRSQAMHAKKNPDIAYEIIAMTLSPVEGSKRSTVYFAMFIVFIVIMMTGGLVRKDLTR